VDDVVQAYLRLIRSEPWGEIFNICSGEPRSVRSVVERLLSFSPRPIRMQTDAALVRPCDAAMVYGSWQKANRVCGFRPERSLGAFDAALREAWEHAVGPATVP